MGPVPEPVVEDGALVVGAWVPEPVVLEGARVVGALVSEPVVVDWALVDGGVEATEEAAAVDGSVDERGDEDWVETAADGADAAAAAAAPGFFCSKANPEAPRPPPPRPMGAALGGPGMDFGAAPGAGAGRAWSRIPRPA